MQQKCCMVCSCFFQMAWSELKFCALGSRCSFLWQSQLQICHLEGSNGGIVPSRRRLRICYNQITNGDGKGKPNVDSRKVQSSTGQKKKRNVDDNQVNEARGFAVLATLVQQRSIQPKVERAKKGTRSDFKLAKAETTKSESNTRSEVYNSGKPASNNGVDRRGKTASSSRRIGSDGNALTDTQANLLDEQRIGRSTVPPRSTEQPSMQNTSEKVNKVNSAEQSFGEAVLAAMQLSALERRKSKERNRKPRETRGSDEIVQQNRNPAQDVRPIVIKPEWASKIEDLERGLEVLKKQYYNKV